MLVLIFRYDDSQAVSLQGDGFMLLAMIYLVSLLAKS